MDIYDLENNTNTTIIQNLKLTQDLPILSFCKEFILYSSVHPEYYYGLYANCTIYKINENRTIEFDTYIPYWPGSGNFQNKSYYTSDDYIVIIQYEVYYSFDETVSVYNVNNGQYTFSKEIVSVGLKIKHYSIQFGEIWAKIE